MYHHEEGRDDPRPLNLLLRAIKLFRKLRVQCKAFLVGYYELTPSEYFDVAEKTKHEHL